MQRLLNVPCVGVRFSFVTSGNAKLALCSVLCLSFFQLEDGSSSFVRNIGKFGTRLHGFTFPRTVDLGVFQFDRQRLVSVKFLALADCIGTRVDARFCPVCLAMFGLNSGNAAAMQPASFILRFGIWECNFSLSVVLCECESWSVTMREDHMLRVFENGC